MKIYLNALAILIFTKGTPTADGGIVFEGGLGWGTASLQAEQTEPTPSYLSYTPRLGFGYSLKQLVDLQVDLGYFPGRRSAAKFGEEQMALIQYGGSVGVRIAEAILVRVGGGHTIYRLFLPQSDEELTGRWRGPSGSLTLGGLIKRNRETSWQIGFKVTHSILRRDSAGSEQRRRLNTVAATVDFVYNDFRNFSLTNKMFKSLLKSF